MGTFFYQAKDWVGLQVPGGQQAAAGEKGLDVRSG